jgi:hypothetical protein
MISKKYKIRMGNPCSYGWENMTATDKGRHCAQCDKVVMDFTSMSDAELIDFLLKHKNVCGHFNKSQLNRTITIEGPKRFKFQHWPAIAAMLVAGLFVVAPAQLTAQKPHPLLHGKVKIEQPQQLYPTNSIGKYSEKDSMVIIGIKVVDSKSKTPLKASVTINGITIQESDKIGCYSLSVNLNDLPEKIQVNIYAFEHAFFSELISVSEFRKKPYYVVELVWEDTQIDGGAIYIEPQH